MVYLVINSGEHIPSGELRLAVLMSGVRKVSQLMRLGPMSQGRSEDLHCVGYYSTISRGVLLSLVALFG